MKATARVKDFLGELPYTAELYWLLRHRDKKIHSRFNLEALGTRLPELVAQVRPYAESAPAGRKVCLFASLHFWISHLAVTGLGLRGLGHDVTLGYLPYSDYAKEISRFDLRRHDLYARHVLQGAAPLLKIVPLLDREPAHHLPEALAQAVERVTVFDTQYTLQREDVTGREPVYRLRYERNLTAARRAYAWLQAERPDVLVVPNGMIQEFGAVYETARLLGIPAVTYEFGEQDQRTWIEQDSPVMYFGGTQALWRARRGRRLDESQRDWLENFVASRQGPATGERFAHLWQKSGRSGGSRIRTELGLDERPVVLLPTNVLGDSATLGRTVFSRSMADWLERLVPFFADKTGVQLVIRIHPGETLTVGPSVVELVRKALPELPAHIHLIGPAEKVNTYDLMEIADLALVYTTTAGLEMALRGLPVLVSGAAHYRGKGFTLEADDWEAYFALLEKTLSGLPGGRLSQPQVEAAWNYAYCFFREYPRPFPWHLERLWPSLDKRPLSYVLSPQGRAEFEATFRQLAGQPVDWEEVHV